jgi:hypothetical protein
MNLLWSVSAVAPLFREPASDRYDRQPIMVFARTLFTIAALVDGLGTVGLMRVIARRKWLK